MLNSFGRYRKAHRSRRRGTTKFMMLLALATAAMLAVMPSATAADSAQPAASVDSAKSEQPAAQEQLAVQDPAAEEPAEKPAAEPKMVVKPQATTDQSDDGSDGQKEPRANPNDDTDGEDGGSDGQKDPRANPNDDTDDPVVVSPSMAEPDWIDATCDSSDVSWGFPADQHVDYLADIPYGDAEVGDTVTVTGTINNPDYEFPDGLTETTWTHTFDAPEGCDEPTVIDAPNGDLPVDDPCGPDNATWILPTGDDVPVGFAWKVAADSILIAEANEGYEFRHPNNEMDPKVRWYGTAPDSGEPCAEVDAPNGDLPVDDPCGPDNATWILPTGDDVPENFTWWVAEDGLLSVVANEGHVFDVPGEELFQKVVEYGYAPDSGELCPVADDPKDFCDILPGIQGEDDNCSTPFSEKAGFIPPTQVGPPAEVDPVVDQPDVVNGALPNTGGPDVLAGVLAMLLLGTGGLLVLTGRTRRRA